MNYVPNYRLFAHRYLFLSQHCSKEKIFFRQICGVHPLQQTITFPPGRCRKRSFQASSSSPSSSLPTLAPVPIQEQHARAKKRAEGGRGGKNSFLPPLLLLTNEMKPDILLPFSLSFSPPQPTAPKQSTHTLEGGGFDGGREQQHRRRLHPALPWFFLCPARLVGHGGIPPRKGGRGRS